MQRDKRSIWNRSRKAGRLTANDLRQVAALIGAACGDLAEELYEEIQHTEDSIRNEMPEDATGLQNDFECLERRVSDLEYAAS